MDRTLILTKAPVAGGAKTRLMPSLGPQEAADLARAFLRDLVDSLRVLVNSHLQLAVPAGDRAELARLGFGAETAMVGQGDGTLGERLARVSERAFREGADTVTLLGSDHPNLPPALLADCRRAGRAGHVGWIPTDDGGFAAMTLPRSLPELFADVPWSTARVADAIRENAASIGVVLEAPGTWYDVDTVDDLRRLAADLAVTGKCPATRRVLESLDPPLEKRP